MFPGVFQSVTVFGWCFRRLVTAVTDTGIGICNLRFLANAAVAGCDKVPGRSSAMLTLVMFSAHPEQYEHELAITLRSVLDMPEDAIAELLKQKMAMANKEDHGRIKGHELMDISRLVMSVAWPPGFKSLANKANMEGEKPEAPKPPAPKPPVDTKVDTKPVGL